MIDWDYETASRRRKTSLASGKLWQVALTIFVLVAALWGAWYALSNAGELERNIDSFDITNSRLLVVEDFERDGVQIFRGRFDPEAPGPYLSIIYSETQTGEMLSESDHLDIERDWLGVRSVKGAAISWFVVRNALIVCQGRSRCETLADELYRITSGETSPRYRVGRNP